MSTWNLQKRISVATSVAPLNALESSIAKAEYLAVDCETEGLDRFTKAVGIGLAWTEDDAVYIPLAVYIPGTGLVDPWEPAAKAQVIEFIKRQLTLSRRLLGHNVSFDAKAISNTFGFDIIPYVYADTQLLHHTAISEEPSHKLKDLARKYLEDAADSPQLDLKESVLANGGQWFTDAKDMFMGDYQILGKYCAYDVIYTFGLFDRFYPKLAEQKLTALWAEEVMPLLRVTHSLNTTGVAIDVDHFKKLAVEIGANINNIEAAIFAEIGDKVADYEYGKILETTKITTKSQLGKHLLALGWDGSEASIPDFKFLIKAWYRNKNGDAPIFNLDSNNDKAYLLYDVLGFACAKMTKSGKRSVTKKDLEELEQEHGDNLIISMLSKRSKETKILTTYVEPILEKSIAGRIYPSFNQTGTTSGRYSSNNPNCQNIPRDDLRIKSGMVPDAGYVFVNADYSSLEPRCFAEMSGEPELKRVYAEGLDLYSHVYITLFNAKEYSARDGDANFLKAKNKAARQGAKEYTLGFAYGMSEYKLAKILGIPVEEALAYKNKYFEAFPRLLNYQKSCKLSMYKNGYISNLLGRRRRGNLLNILYRIGVPLDNKWKLRGAYEKFKTRYFAEYETVEKFLGAVSNEINNSYNFPIQSLAAAIVNAACIKFATMAEQLQLDARIMLQVHDEITILCHSSIANKVAALLKECMESNNVTKLLSVPMQAEPIITDKSLAEAK